MAFPLHVMNSEKEIFGVSSSFHKNTIPIPITTLYLGTHWTWITPLKNLTPNTVMWMLGFWHTNFGQYNLVHCNTKTRKKSQTHCLYSLQDWMLDDGWITFEYCWDKELQLNYPVSSQVVIHQSGLKRIPFQRPQDSESRSLTYSIRERCSKSNSETQFHQNRELKVGKMEEEKNRWRTMDLVLCTHSWIGNDRFLWEDVTEH